MLISDSEDDGPFNKNDRVRKLHKDPSIGIRMPPDRILGDYLDRVNMRRDEIDKLPVVADRLSNGYAYLSPLPQAEFRANRSSSLRFVDVSGPGRSVLVKRSDIEAIWRWFGHTPLFDRQYLSRISRDNPDLRKFFPLRDPMTHGAPFRQDAATAEAIEESVARGLFSDERS